MCVVVTNVAGARVTRWVCEKAAQNEAQPFICHNQYKNFTVGQSTPKIRATSEFSKKIPKESITY
jgi:hypothetical protein